jgi:hypothetical protein
VNRTEVNSRRGGVVLKLRALRFACALLLPVSRLVLADPPDAGDPPDSARLLVFPTALRADHPDVRPGIALVGTTLGASGHGVLALDYANADATAIHTRDTRIEALLRVAVYTDGGVGWRRLDNSCHGNNADRCSLLSVVFGIHGASASMQWREDGARALVARREFAHDALHLRVQLNYRFD